MKTVKQVATLTGVSVRTLHYYDELGLLTPSEVTAAGYRLYGDDKLERRSRFCSSGSWISRCGKLRAYWTARIFPGKRRFASRNGC